MGAPAERSSSRGGWLAQKWSKKPVWVALVVAVLLVVTGTIATAMSLSGDDETLPTASSGTGTGEVVDPHEICINQLTAVVKHLVNDRAYNPEMMVNGQNDPFYVAAGPMVATAMHDRFQIGDTEALVKLDTDASRVCSTTLNDAIRPNYPTDGTWPE